MHELSDPVNTAACCVVMASAYWQSSMENLRLFKPASLLFYQDLAAIVQSSGWNGQAINIGTCGTVR